MEGTQENQSKAYCIPHTISDSRKGQPQVLLHPSLNSEKTTLQLAKNAGDFCEPECEPLVETSCNKIHKESDEVSDDIEITSHKIFRVDLPFYKSLTFFGGDLWAKTRESRYMNHISKSNY